MRKDLLPELDTSCSALLALRAATQARLIAHPGYAEFKADYDQLIAQFHEACAAIRREFNDATERAKRYGRLNRMQNERIVSMAERCFGLEFIEANS